MLGVGGRLQTRAIDTMPSFVGSPTAIPIPSLLGRDSLARFALFMEERSGRVLLLVGSLLSSDIAV